MLHEVKRAKLRKTLKCMIFTDIYGPQFLPQKNNVNLFSDDDNILFAQ